MNLLNGMMDFNNVCTYNAMMYLNGKMMALNLLLKEYTIIQ